MGFEKQILSCHVLFQEEQMLQVVKKTTEKLLLWSEYIIAEEMQEKKSMIVICHQTEGKLLLLPQPRLSWESMSIHSLQLSDGCDPSEDQHSG